MRLPRLRTGMPWLDNVFGEWVDSMERSATWSVAPPINMRVGPEGRHLWLAGEQSFYARLIGSTSPYQFGEVYGKPDFTWGDLPGARTGADAYEDNSRAGLGGKVVKLALAEDGVYHFQWKSGYACNWLFTVARCNGTSVQPNAVVTIYAAGDLGGTPLATCTTNVSGVCGLSVPPGSYDLRIVPPVGSGHATHTASGVAHTCDQTTNVTLATDGDNVCNPGFCPCDIMPAVLELTLTFTSWTGGAFPDDTLTYVPSPGPGDPNSWKGASTFMANVGIHGMVSCRWRLECTGPLTMRLAAVSQDPTKPGSAFVDTLIFTTPADVCYPFSASESTTGPFGTVDWSLLG